jgi:hypothetical protein
MTSDMAAARLRGGSKLNDRGVKDVEVEVKSRMWKK